MRQLLVLAALLAAASPAAAQSGSWSTRANSTNTMYWGGSCGDGTYAYYWGGNGNGGTTSHYRYSPATNSWSTMAPTPTAVLNASGCSLGGYNYSFGSSTGTTGVTYRYTISTNSWTNLAVTCPSTYRSAAATNGTSIYLVGGLVSGGYSGNLYRYNVASNTYTTLASITGASMNGPGLAYSPVSGTLVATYLTGCWEYAIAADTWTPRLAVPATRQYHTSFAGPSGRIYVVGGGSSTLRTDEFDPNTNEWNPRADCTIARPNLPGSAVIAGKVYVYGGNTSLANCEEFTPPAFGQAPNAAVNVQQIGATGVLDQAGADPDKGWTDANVTFSATLSDPDAGQDVRLVAQVKLAADPWTSAVPVASALGPQGVHSVNYGLPAGGDYDWRYQVQDSFGNVTPNVGGVPDWIEFQGNTVSPDFRSDQVLPSAPQPVFPLNQDVLVPSLVSGDATLIWSAATDNGPPTAIRYDVEVALNDPAFGTVTASANGLVPTNVTFNLAVHRDNYYWRVRAVDIGGNLGPWSSVESFRVVGDDGLNHSSGDAHKALGCSAGAGASGTAALLGLGFAIAAALRRR